ncbi:transporter substrate-binding domain-containing protein, partial [Christensenellaceae bacterium OttesenSCG-928-K19]|nr:transporter substrate-binding domain-containing protein [Christensenellaceae bacterium OttesenSCG-928-K19]
MHKRTVKLNIRILIAFLLLFCCLFAGCFNTGESTGEEQATLPVLDYREVDGVTQTEIDAIEALKAEHTGFEVAMNYSTEAFTLIDGSIGGYSSLFCEFLSQLFDMKFSPAVYEWDALIDGLNSHDIDFSGELTATPERQERYFMTDAIAQRSIKYFQLADSPLLSETAAKRELRYAFLDGSTALDYVKESSEYPFAEVFVDDYQTVMQLLESGDIDAFFDDGTAEAVFDEYGRVQASEYFPLIYAPVSLTTANPELKPFISVVQKCLEHEGVVYYLTSLYNQGYQDYMVHKLTGQMTAEEKEYLQAHTQPGVAIPIALEYDNYPMCFYNHQEGEWQGIAVDVLREVEKLTGLTFEAANEEGTDFLTLLALLESGEAAILSELIPSPDRLDEYLWPDE